MEGGREGGLDESLEDTINLMHIPQFQLRLFTHLSSLPPSLPPSLSFHRIGEVENLIKEIEDEEKEEAEEAAGGGRSHGREGGRERGREGGRESGYGSTRVDSLTLLPSLPVS